MTFIKAEDKFSDDLHIYPITEIRNLLYLHVLKFDPSIKDFFGENPQLTHRTPCFSYKIKHDRCFCVNFFSTDITYMTCMVCFRLFVNNFNVEKSIYSSKYLEITKRSLSVNVNVHVCQA